jgi:CubicO group peptidase (beta-lactamase class C family)
MLSGGGALGSTRLIGRQTLSYMTANHLASGVVVDPALNLLSPGHGFGLGFAVRTAPGLASLPGSVGTYNWGGIAGTVFWVDPVEELHALLMIQAPGQRDIYRALFRNMVYAAIE